MMYDDLDNHSLLLLYAANELPAEEALRVERMLGQDAKLRDELQSLRDCYLAIGQSLAAGDQRGTMPTQMSAAVRQATRAMQEWQADRSRRAARHEGSARRWRLDWRGYVAAAAAAAVIAVGMFVWFDSASDSPQADPVVAEAPPENPRLEAFVAAFTQSIQPPNSHSDDFARAEQAMDQLKTLTEIGHGGELDSELQ